MGLGVRAPCGPHPAVAASSLPSSWGGPTAPALFLQRGSRLQHPAHIHGHKLYPPGSLAWRLLVRAVHVERALKAPELRESELT